MVVHRDGKWKVLNHDGTKVLGTYETKEDAVKRLGEIERAKYWHKEHPTGK